MMEKEMKEKSFFEYSYLKIFLIALCVWLAAGVVKAQKVSSLYVSSSQQTQNLRIEKGTKLINALEKIEHQFAIVFLYRTGVIQDKMISRTIHLPDNIAKALQKLLKNQGLKYRRINSKTYEVYPNNEVKVQHEVHGIVTNAETGTPMPGVNIIVRGTTSGTTTNEEGVYSLRAPSPQDTLVFSFIGYQREVVPIRGRTQINIALQSQTIVGEELVVIGYGTRQAGNVNTSMTSISSEAIDDVPAVTVSQLLQGTAAGVTVMQNSGMPGGAMSVRIRGITSISGSNEPLYVIDGVPISGDANNSATSGRSIAPNYSGRGTDTVSPLTGLNPNDIKSINILKGAAALAIYGSRGANGVVIITTKSGQAGESTISYSGYIGSQEVIKHLNLMELPEYAHLTNYLATFYGREPSVAFSRPEILGAGTDWQDAIYQHAFMQSHQLSFSGGNKKVQYYISGGYLDQKGIILGSDMSRYTLKTNIDAQLADWFKAGTNLNLSSTKQGMPITGGPTGAVLLALSQSPAVPVYNPDGTFAGPILDSNGNPVGHTNPVARALNVTNKVNRKKFLGNVYATIDITDHLVFKSSFGGNVTSAKNKTFTPTYKRGTNQNNTASASVGRQEYKYWIWKNYFTYKNTFAEKHRVTFMLGQEAQKSSWEGMSATGQGFISNDVRTLNMASPVSIGGFAGSYTLASYYTRLIYSFDNTYGLTATLRADGSSKFAEGNRWGYFPSIAGSWKVYQESFMKGINKYVDELTLQVGYGITGSQNLGNFLFTSNLNAISTGLGMGFAVFNIANPELMWEEQRQINLGLSFSLFNSHLDVNVEVYRKISDKFLFQLPLPAYLTGGPAYQGGINSPYVNLGEMLNKGIDITLKGSIQANNFSWNSTLTFSHFQNEVLTLDNRLNITESFSTGFVSTPITRTVKGKPVGLFYGYKVKGIFNNEETIRDQPKQFGIEFAPRSENANGIWLGDVQYVDVNGDGVINADDRTFIGNPHPDFTFGFRNSFSYKNVSLSVFLQGSYGNKILNLTRMITGGLNRPYRNQLEAVSDYWTWENRDAEYPRPRPGDANPNLKVSERFVEDGSYIRVKNIKLSYTLPVDFTRQFSISRFNIYASVENLATFTKYSGYDPEVGSFNQQATRTGVDFGRYPSARTYTIGLNIDF